LLWQVRVTRAKDENFTTKRGRPRLRRSGPSLS